MDLASTTPEQRAGAPTQPAAGRATLVLAVAGALLTTVYLVATLRIPLPRYFPSAQISRDFVYMLGPGWEWPTVLYVGFVAVTFALYGVALAVVWRTRAVSRPLLFAFPVLFSAALLAMYPPTAVDMFHYHAMGRVLWVFRENPLITPQGELPYPIGISWADLPSPYGPLWSLLAAPASLLPGDHYIAELLAFKAMGAASLLGCTALVWLLVRRTRPGAEAFAVVLFAWNPFVLMRAVGNGHNDLWMMLFVLLALERIERGRWNTSIVMLTLGVLVKFVPALLGPPFLLYIWRHGEGTQRRRALRVVEAMAAGAAVAAVVYLPFWEGLATLETLRKESAHMITSTPVLLQLATTRYFEEPLATRLATLVPKLVFVVMYVPLTWHARRGSAELVSMSFAVLFLYLVVAASWFRPWYMLWPLTLAALRPGGWWAATLVTVTLAAAFPDLVEQYRGHWPLIAEYHRAVAAPIVLAFLPPLLVWSWAIGATDSFTLEHEGRSTA